MDKQKLIQVHIVSGQTHKDMGDYETAIDEFTEAIKLNQNSPDSYLERGYCYRDKYHRGDRNPAYLKSAIDDFNKAKLLLTNPS